MADFSHLAQDATARMVDVSGKEDTSREAAATGELTLPSAIAPLLTDEMVREIACVARVAGIQAMKQTAILIPMCHNVPLESTQVDIELDRLGCRFIFKVTAKSRGKTGVEMECLVGVSIVGATIYDMIKARAPEAILGPYCVVTKSGGKHGSWQHPNLNA